jgi:hypothetical protein
MTTLCKLKGSANVRLRAVRVIRMRPGNFQKTGWIKGELMIIRGFWWWLEAA